MGRLKNSIFYLSGPIDDVSKEHSVGWRDDITKFLFEIGAGVFNPLDKPTLTGLESYVGTQERLALKQAGKFDEVRDIMKAVCSTDMRLVDLSHALILYIDKSVHMCGSYIEAAWAALEKKPIIVMCKQGKANVPDFLIGITPHAMFFDSWEQAKNYIVGIDDGTIIDTMKRWQFIDSNIVYGVSI